MATALAPVQRKEYHVIVDAQTNKEDRMSPTLKTMLKAAACFLVCLGLFFVVGGSIFFGVGIAAGCGVINSGISAIMLSSASTMIPLGITSLLSGCHLFYISEKGSFYSKNIGLTDLIKIK